MSRPIWTVLVAAGSGNRLGGGEAKQYVQLAGRAMLLRALDPFLACADPERIVIVIPDGDKARVSRLLSAGAPDIEARLVVGGATRQESVKRGLDAIDEDKALVAVHDAARPLLDPVRLQTWLDEAAELDALVPVLPAVDTIVETDGPQATRVLDRERLGLVQTPQIFDLALLRRAHRAAAERGQFGAVDDGSLVLALGERLNTRTGDPGNFKITDPADLERANRLLEARDG